METLKLPSMADLYNGRTVFVTGASGFVGKVMVEKMLYSLPGLARVYVLIRAGKGKSGAERWTNYEKLALFNRIRRECPDRLAKVEVIEGDIALAELGIAEHKLANLLQETSMVFHCAATIKLNGTLAETVNVNMQDTLRVLSLCAAVCRNWSVKPSRLQCYLHCSTCYVNSDKKGALVAEKLYPAPCDPQMLIKAKDSMNAAIFESIGKGACKMFGNTYCFTKNLTEHLVNDSALPALIFRPSGIGSIWKDGIPGWIDVLQGAAGLTALFCSGPISRIPIDLNGHVDGVPVDIVSSAMLAAAAYRITMRRSITLLGQLRHAI